LNFLQEILIELFDQEMAKNIVSNVLLLTALFISLRRKRLSSSVRTNFSGYFN
jgi:hypothetical protein